MAAFEDWSAPKKVERYAVVEIQIALDRRQVDRSLCAHLIWMLHVVLFHDSHVRATRARCRLADEHVVRFLGEHEAGGAGQRVEARFRSAQSWNLPSRSVKYVNMKKAKPIRVRSLNAARMRGLS